MKIIEMLTPWKRIRELEWEVETAIGQRDLYCLKSERLKESVNRIVSESGERIAELARDVEIHKDNAAELEMCVAELKQKLTEAQKNDKRGKDGRYSKS